jgi:hypothetical protein
MREWSDQDDTVLKDAEKWINTMKLSLGVLDLWTDNVGDEVDPDDLPEELKHRVSDVMWKVSMLMLIIDEPGPGSAFKNVIDWAQKMKPDMIHIKEVGSLEEFEQLTGDQNTERKEGRAGYL